MTLRKKTMRLVIFCALIACAHASIMVDVTMVDAGLECVWGEWPADDIAGWNVTGDKPHHLIVYATTMDAPPDGIGCRRQTKNNELVYVWGGEQRFEYGERTVYKPKPNTRYFVEVHNHGNKPLHVRLDSVKSQKVAKRQAWIVVSAIRSGRVWPGETKTFETPRCVSGGKIDRLRMHSHFALRQQMFVDNQSVLDTKQGDSVNQWYKANGWDKQAFYARCTYDKDSAIGITWCDGCQKEMCNAYAQVSAPFDRLIPLSQTACVGPGHQ